MAKQKYLFKDYVNTLSARFRGYLDHIQYFYGFGSAAEFEVAICRMLQSALPQQFGVCRGHVVNGAGDQAGDDIIIYDRLRCPTLRLLPQEDFSRKEWVPIHAVYAYIEAKHTLNLEKKEEEEKPDEKKKIDGTTLLKACKQIEAVKSLCGQREPIPLHRITRSFQLDQGTVGAPPGWPDIRNPFFAMILSRFVRNKTDEHITDPNVIAQQLKDHGLSGVNAPDLIVAGPSNLVSPCPPNNEGGPPVINFFHRPDNPLESLVVNQIAFGIGLSILLQVLDRIQLGEVPWVAIINNALGR
jgi:hypothetical protein